MEQSPDGRVLAAGQAQDRDDLTPKVWIVDATTLEIRRTVRLGETDFPFDLSFSPDGRRLAIGGSLGVINVLDTATWRRTQEPVKVHDQFLQQVEWMPDSLTVFTSGADGTVSLYDAERGLVRGRPLPASSDLQVASGLEQGYTHLIPPTNDEIVAHSGERPGHRYPLDPSRWLDQACAVAGRNLTRDEWARYLPSRPYHRTCTDR